MKIELCSASIEALLLAEKYNFDRVELCQALEHGGLTPSIGFQQKSLSFSRFETHVLIRCRAGGFCYNQLEKEIMLADMKESVKLGVHGLVIGALILKNGIKELDVPFLEKIKLKFPQTELTFHRAFDEVENKEAAVLTLKKIGFNRILCSGGMNPISENFMSLKAIQKKAQDKIEIMLGGGLNPENIKSICSEISPDAIHFSGTLIHKTHQNSNFDLDLLLPSEKKIEEILKKLNSLNN
jgi:copper homeostasis protein